MKTFKKPAYKLAKTTPSGIDNDDNMKKAARKVKDRYKGKTC